MLFLPLVPVGEEAVLGPHPVFMPQAGDSEAELELRRRSPGTRTKLRTGFSAEKPLGNKRKNTWPSGTGVVRRMVLCWVALEGRDTVSEGKLSLFVKVKWKWKSLSRSLWPHEILQAKILEWVAFPFSRGSSRPRDQTQVSHIAGRFFTSWATREAQEHWSG